MKHPILFLLLFLIMAGAVPLSAQEGKRVDGVDGAQNPGALIGAGNFNNGSMDKNAEAQFRLLKAVGGTRIRVNLYPSV